MLNFVKFAILFHLADIKSRILSEHILFCEKDIEIYHCEANSGKNKPSRNELIFHKTIFVDILFFQ